MLGHGYANDSSTVVREDDEYEEQPEGSAGVRRPGNSTAVIVVAAML
jgi:hypothetical protein